MKRVSVDNYFMKFAHVAKTRSTCLRRHVGAVIVNDKKIISTGYNGAPSGSPHCEEVGCTREGIPSGVKHELCRGVHAEQNAIIQANDCKGATIYISLSPCMICAKMIINAGIKRVVFDDDYPDKNALNLLYQSGVIVERFHGEENNEI